MTADRVWRNCLAYIEDNIDAHVYRLWFLPVKAVKILGSTLTVEVPSKFFYEFLEEHYIKLLKSAIIRELGKDAKLIYAIPISKNMSDSRETVLENLPGLGRSSIKPQDVSANSSSQAIKNPFAVPGINALKVESQLNPAYNFDNFIEGEANHLARFAGLTVSGRPGESPFNPLFIFGGVGLGKTHLAHAIGVSVKEKYPEKTVLYVSAEKFIRQYTESTLKNTRNDFVHFYQLMDVLIVDDVQFLSGKPKTQDVFFHIFNHLHQSGKQVVLTSDKVPVDIQDIEERLLSRFKWGLSAELQKPDYKMRYDILKNMIYRDGVEVPEEVVEHLAKNIQSNIRELEGAKISLIAQSFISKKEITIDTAKNIVKNIVKDTPKDISIEGIQKIVLDYFNIDEKSLHSRTRKRHIVQARQLTMFLAKKYTKESLSSIGSQIGKRDHATVLHACKTVNNLSEIDKHFRKYVEDLCNKVTG